MLGDPARRAAYDRALACERQPAARVPAAPAGCRYGGWPTRWPGGMTPMVRVPGPPLRAGPVRVEDPRQASPAAGWDEQDIRLAVLAELALRYLARGRGRPW